MKRFWDRVNKTDTCWIWTASVNNRGYGKFSCWLAHRFAWELVVGPIKQGFVLDHICKNRRCVNPEHLHPVVQFDNVLRGAAHYNSIRTHCKHGHAFDQENTRITKRGRVCRQCERDRKRTCV